MRQRTWALIVALSSVVTLASGCSSCNVDRHARAQGVDGGVRSRPGPMTTASCYLRASRETPLLQSQINELCFGAPTPDGPVDCYLAATGNLIMTDPQKITLCHCASSNEPAVCYRRLQRDSMLITSQIETMCSPSISQGLLANCRPIGGGYY